MSETSAPRTVVFDLGGVLIDWNPRHLYRKMFDDEAETERFLREICSNAWNLQMDRGMPFEEGVATLSQKHPDMAPYIEAFWIRWEEMIEGAIDGIVEILKQLYARDVPLYALSNWSAQTWPFARDRFTFLELFKGLVISGFEGTMKPEEKIFRILLERHDIDPATAVFIDDRVENVAVAERLGIRGVHFTGPAELSANLSRMGLL
ncbi:MAG: HAD family phosphatase [Rhodospirillaceae bacterium]|nr:HAD family phosphatase [Rhodospirillaceae bacterium]